MSKQETMSWTTFAPNKSDSAVPLPAPATTASYNLTPGAYTQFLFRMNEVKDVAFDQQSGTLKMNLANGSAIVVQNFKDLARSAETCGRDTVLQFMRDETAANGQVSTKIVNIAPDVLLKTLDPSAMPDGMTIVGMPPAGVTREVVVVPGQKYRFDFDWAGAAKTEDGTNVMLSFKNSGLVILRDFVPVMQGDLPAKMTLTDGTVIDASKLIVTACTPSESPMAKLANIEPAAGERHEASSHPRRVAHVPHQDSAQKLANIEPAAGDGTPGQSGNRGSAGFSSGIDDAGLNGLNRLGGLAPTSLTYGIPRLPDQVVLRSDESVPGAPVIPPVTPPPAPSLTAQDSRVYEDSSVALSVTTTAPAGTSTVLTISGFPAGWVVDAGLGTFDVATRTWTISVPAGATFTGGPVVHPPGNTDGDITILDVQAVATDTTTGLSSARTEDIIVTTDAVVDTPDLSASIIDVTGMVAALAIATAPTDLDGSEQITAVYVGPLPAGVTLDKGALQADGRYLLSVTDLSNIHVVAPAGYNGTVTFDVTSVVTETRLSGGEFDLTNNVATRTVPVSVTFTTLPDGTPTIGDSQCDVDESIIAQETLWATGDYNYSYGPDGAGAVTLSTFGASGSLMNGTLSSGGVPIAVTIEGNSFVGRAGNVVVFKMDVNTANATYRFEQYKTIDHADGSNANDVITLDFGVQITDSDGDSDTGTLRITIADDAPIAHDDAGGLSGNVMANDTVGADVMTQVIQVSYNNVVYTVPAGGQTQINAAHGVLTLTSAGAYTYTAHNGANGGDVFTYTVRDFDGDMSSAQLSIATTDGAPTIGDASGQVDETGLWTASPDTIVRGQLNYNFGADGAGTITPTGVSSFTATGSMTNGQLTMGGLPVVVTLVGNTYKGQVTWPDDGAKGDIFDLIVNADGSYAFHLYNTLDHADGLNPNDVITLNFGVNISDADGDTDTGVISINVLDDAPIARDDGAIVNAAGIASGRVIDNDYYSYDDMQVTSVTVNGVTVTPPDDPADGRATLVGTYGTFTIDSNGAYTYTARNGATGSDVLTYTLTDIDGDQSTAKLTVGINDGIPTIGDDTKTVDETNLGPITVNGALDANYGSNGAGSITAQGNTFSASGSLRNGALTANGQVIAVTLSGNTWTGSTVATGALASVVLFTLVLHNDGTYAFTLCDNLDHANAANPNDIITLNFGAAITDSDGDTDTGTITIHVVDDAPIARDDTVSAYFNNVGSGNVLANDTSTEDPVVTSVTFGGQTYVVPDTGATVVQGQHGTLTMEQNGHYTYTPYDATTETICLNPVSSDVTAANDSDLSRNGITITAINTATGAVAGDLTWISGDITVDGSWYGEQGVGIAGSGSQFINGTSEAMRIAFDAPQDDVTITIAGFNSMSDFVDGVTESPLHARVYVSGSTTPIEVILSNGWSSGYGLVDYTLTSTQFGNRDITKVEVFSTQSNADWNLYNVSFDGVAGPGTDTFQYTATDRDGDAATAFLNATNTTPLPTATASAVEFVDSVQSAINDYVVSTTETSHWTATSPANDAGLDTSTYVVSLDDELSRQSSIAA